MRIMFGLASAILIAAPAAAVTVTVSYENAGVQTAASTSFDFLGVETFEAAMTGSGQTYNTSFGGSEISGQYTNLRVDGANQYGSAGGAGNHAVAPAGGAGYELTLSTARTEGVNYFGYWLSALDAGNVLEFYKAGNLLYTFNPTNVITSIGGCNPQPQPYCGNPNDASPRRVLHEQFAFVNIYFEDDTFDKIKFYESAGAGGNYESDNHTVGYFIEKGGNTVPEPATWAMLITGFGMTGLAARRRRRMVSTPA
jgi:hypothetical protein